MDNLDAYIKLIQHPVFSIEQVEQLVGKRSTAYALLTRLINKGVVVKIRGGLYSPINLVTKEITASPYQIACAVADNAFLCQATAMAYHGIQPRPLLELQIAADSRFNPFSFDGKLYKQITIQGRFGLIASDKEQGVRTTDLKKTFLTASNGAFIQSWRLVVPERVVRS